jgi:hypothetical protein
MGTHSIHPISPCLRSSRSLTHIKQKKQLGGCSQKTDDYFDLSTRTRSMRAQSCRLSTMLPVFRRGERQRPLFFRD